MDMHLRTEVSRALLVCAALAIACNGRDDDAEATVEAPASATGTASAGTDGAATEHDATAHPGTDGPPGTVGMTTATVTGEAGDTGDDTGATGEDTGEPACATALDGACDEVGLGSGTCPAGTDYWDCGYCPWPDDGECDEGLYCPVGTDPTDCQKDDLPCHVDPEGDVCQTCLADARTACVQGGVCTAEYDSLTYCLTQDCVDRFGEPTTGCCDSHAQILTYCLNSECGPWMACFGH